MTGIGGEVVDRQRLTSGRRDARIGRKRLTTGIGGEVVDRERLTPGCRREILDRPQLEFMTRRGGREFLCCFEYPKLTA